jgi:hypothetical protein
VQGWLVETGDPSQAWWSKRYALSGAGVNALRKERDECK